jgi:AcrR family transcriptional regulator
MRRQVVIYTQHMSVAKLTEPEVRQSGAKLTEPEVRHSEQKLTRTEVRQRQTRLRLREVASRLMAEQGVDATTIQQITDAADIGFGTFYNYAASKEALAKEVLDCIIHNIGERNDLVTQMLQESDTVRIVANSVRFVIREMTLDPVFRWWVDRVDVLVDRMRIGFGPFGLRDIDHAVRAGRYDLIDGEPGYAWSQLVWLMAAAGSDIVRGVHPPSYERVAVEGILRVMGVDHDSARAACTTALPIAPPLAIDYAFEIGLVNP